MITGIKDLVQRLKSVQKHKSHARNNHKSTDIQSVQKYTQYFLMQTFPKYSQLGFTDLSPSTRSVMPVII
jgi:hypothetical protein